MISVQLLLPFRGPAFDRIIPVETPRHFINSLLRPINISSLGPDVTSVLGELSGQNLPVSGIPMRRWLPSM